MKGLSTSGMWGFKRDREGETDGRRISALINDSLACKRKWLNTYCYIRFCWNFLTYSFPKCYRLRTAKDLWSLVGVKQLHEQSERSECVQKPHTAYSVIRTPLFLKHCGKGHLKTRLLPDLKPSENVPNRGTKAFTLQTMQISLKHKWSMFCKKSNVLYDA